MQALRQWERLATIVSNAYSIPPTLTLAVIWCASRGQAERYNPEHQAWLRHLARQPQYAGMEGRRVSAVYGLMQVRFTTAVELGMPVEEDPEQLFLPRVNLHYGCKHLRDLLAWATPLYLDAALAAYYGGSSGNTPGGRLRPDCARWADRVMATQRVLSMGTTPPRTSLVPVHGGPAPQSP